MNNFDKINPYKPLTLDCQVWAQAKHEFLTDLHCFKVRFLCIEPLSGRNVGPYKLPEEKGGGWHPSSGGGVWAHHYAVILDAKFVVDELYPDGLPIDEYMDLFLHKEALRFEIRDECI